ncbi:MAG TPA: protoporphyrinogen oxidase [Candidatus Acidoferrales bacterium]
MDDSKQVVVIGGGISGLSCAYRLRQLGIPVVLFEMSPQLGGLMASVEKDGFRFESGPQTFQSTPLLTQLIHELKLEADLLQANQRSPRYILRRGHMQKVSMSPQGLLAGSFLSPKSRWKIASEPFRRTTAPSEEESLANFVRRKFGHEILEYLVSPFVSGVYAGDPEKLSLRAAFPSLEEWEREYGSIIRGAIKSRKKSGANGPPAMCSFRKGMATFPTALATSLGETVKSGASVAFVAQPAPGKRGYEIRIDDSHQNAATVAAAAVVFAAPAYAVSHMVQPLSEPLAETLSGIAYASVVVYATGYYNKQAVIAPDGFGVLIPRSEKHRTLGIVWNSSLFPERAPEGQFGITSFLGGATDPELIKQSDQEIAATAEKDSATILGIIGTPIASALWRHPRALPQYNLGHGHIVKSLRDAERTIPGIFFSGNYLEGPSIGKCVEHAFKTAEAVRDHLKTS